MIGEDGEGTSYPMLEREVRNPVIKETFEQRMERYKEEFIKEILKDKKLAENLEKIARYQDE